MTQKKGIVSRKQGRKDKAASPAVPAKLMQEKAGEKRIQGHLAARTRRRQSKRDAR